ncbi:MAG: DUF4115 domain-containing protein [Alphaproteobacteria bacterium]|nr:DUF4115 domain-containing protein [Alphaproteobacteria bacterium]
MSDTEEQTAEQQARQAPSSSVGALLKATRTRMGQDLKQVSQALRIRQLFLQAIEDGRYEDLPGPTYALGFVRSYADFLGLDSEEVVRRYRAETSGAATSKKELVFPSPASERRLPSGALAAAALALGVLVYGGWYAFSSANRPVAESVPEVPDQLAKSDDAAKKDERAEEASSPSPASPPPAVTEAAKPVEKPAEKAEAKPVEPAMPKVEPVPEKKAEPALAKPEAVEAAAPKKPEPPRIEPGKPGALTPGQTPMPLPSSQGMGGLAISAQPRTAMQSEMKTPASPASTGPAAAQPAPAPAPAGEANAPSDEASRSPKVYGQTEGEVRVVLKANSDSWIQVRDEKGNLVATRLMKKGDTYRVPTGMGKLSLTTGDAGALSASVDGALSTPSLGPSGSVRRDIALDPERIKAGNP